MATIRQGFTSFQRIIRRSAEEISWSPAFSQAKMPPVRPPHARCRAQVSHHMAWRCSPSITPTTTCRQAVMLVHSLSMDASQPDRGGDYGFRHFSYHVTPPMPRAPGRALYDASVIYFTRHASHARASRQMRARLRRDAIDDAARFTAGISRVAGFRFSAAGLSPHFRRPQARDHHCKTCRAHSLCSRQSIHSQLTLPFRPRSQGARTFHAADSLPAHTSIQRRRRAFISFAASARPARYRCFSRETPS